MSSLTYAELDDTLSAWVKRHGLHVSTQYKDEEVRSILIVDDVGCEYQMWLELHPPDRIKVVAWDYAKRAHSQMCARATLRDALEAAYGAVEQWIHHDGHTRTPVL